MCESCGRGVLSRMSADVGSFVGLGDSSSGGSGPLAPSPFRLPAAYEEAKERKVSAVSDLRNAVKAVRDHPSSQDSVAAFPPPLDQLGTEAQATHCFECSSFKCPF